MKTKETGATLVVVLILLVIITIIGTLAVKSSLTALNIATNSQAQQLLVQNSDSALFNVENPALLTRNLAYDGLFGFIKSDVNKGKELVFCYRGGQSKFFTLSSASVMMWVSGTQPTNNSFSTNGYCRLNGTGDFFTSGRQAVMTQVALKVQLDPSSESAGLDDPFEFMQRGTDTESAKVDNAERIMVTAVSIVPALTSASDTDINNCFSKHMNQVIIPNGVTAASGFDKSVSQCLQDLGVPVNTQITEYNLIQAFDNT
jgi:hypothetical protein